MLLCFHKCACAHTNSSGAAAEGDLEGIPAVAFSGISNAKVSFTTLKSDPTTPATLAAVVYAKVTTKVVQTLFAGAASGQRLVPMGTIISINYPALNFSSGSQCSEPKDIKWVFSRQFKAGPLDHDIDICNNGGKLPDEGTVTQDGGCFASVVVLDSLTKLQAGTDAQQEVYNSLSALGFTCLTDPQ